MKNKLLIGTIVAIVSFVIATTILIPLVVWIFLVWMVRKKKTKIFRDQMEPKLAERRLKKLKTFLLVAGISFAVSIVGIAVHNGLYGMNEIEESVSFYIALVGLWAFATATISGLVILLKGGQKTT